jgi:SAM-dependent methyltransferase
MRPEYNKDYFAKRNQLFSFLKAGLFAFLIKIFLKPRTLLDVGCAGGELVKITSMLGIKTFGIDISKSAINCANKDSGGSFARASILSIPFEDDSFDVVVSLAVMEHILSTDADRALTEAMRVAKRFILLQICVKDNPLEWNKHYLEDSTHVNVMFSKWWREKFKNLEMKYKEIIPNSGIFLLYKVRS